MDCEAGLAPSRSPAALLSAAKAQFFDSLKNEELFFPNSSFSFYSTYSTDFNDSVMLILSSLKLMAKLAAMAKSTVTPKASR